MALKFYFEEDVLNILQAVFVASQGSATLVLDMLGDADLEGVPLEKLLRIYQRGVTTTIGAVALGFGLDVLSANRQAHEKLARLLDSRMIT